VRAKEEKDRVKRREGCENLALLVGVAAGISEIWTATASIERGVPPSPPPSLPLPLPLSLPKKLERTALKTAKARLAPAAPDKTMHMLTVVGWREGREGGREGGRDARKDDRVED
jgi:hypothetical protein